jgi:carboxyl-terminal processing protease
VLLLIAISLEIVNSFFTHKQQTIFKLKQRYATANQQPAFDRDALKRKFLKWCGILATASSLSGLPLQSNAVGDNIFNEVWSQVNQNYYDPTFNGNDWENIKTTYTKKLEMGADERALTEKMLKLLGDKYSRLLDKKYYESLWKYDAVGVGVLFHSAKGEDMTVSAPPISGSSGAKAGLQKDDVIVSINGKPAIDMTAMSLLDMMSNDESDTVSMEYFRPSDPNVGSRKSPLKLDLPRTYEKAANPVSYYTATGSNGKLAGYIRLKEFNSEATNGVKQALDEFKGKGVEEIVLDLRGNTGGAFQVALNIGGMFMNDKVMVDAVGRMMDSSYLDKQQFRSSYDDGVQFTGQLVVLTDALSASASEVLAIGLHDNCRAVVAGSKSFGKGLIQGVIGLSDGEGITLTVAQYVSPKGTIIQKMGVTPDFPLNLPNAYKNLVMPKKFDVGTFDFDRAKAIENTCSPFQEKSMQPLTADGGGSDNSATSIGANAGVQTPSQS